MPEDVGEEYASSLADLTCNSKPLINMLTMLAEENYDHAAIIVQVIEKHLQKAKPEFKLPCLYLVDSIVKNIGKDYVNLVTQHIVTTFCSVFEKVDETTRAQMFKLRSTWNDIFPSKKLYAIDLRVKSIDPAWPITAPCPSSIHLNPKFLPAHANQVPAPHTPVANPHKEPITAVKHVAGPGTAQPPEVSSIPPAIAATGPEITEVEMREHLLNKQKELLELEQKKVELELLQVKARLEQRQRELALRLAAEQLLTGPGAGAPIGVPASAATANVEEQLAASILAIQKLTDETDSLTQKMEATKSTGIVENVPCMPNVTVNVTQTAPIPDPLKHPVSSPVAPFDPSSSLTRGDPRLGYQNGLEPVSPTDVKQELHNRQELLFQQEALLLGRPQVLPNVAIDVKSAESSFNSNTTPPSATSKSNKSESHLKNNTKKRDTRDRGSSREKDRTSSSNSSTKRDRDRSGHRGGRDRDRDREKDKDGTKKRERDGRDHRKRERKDSASATDEDRGKMERDITRVHSKTAGKENSKEDLRYGRKNGDEAADTEGMPRKNSKDGTSHITGGEIEPSVDDNYRELESILMGHDGGRLHDLRLPSASPKRRISGEEGVSESKKRKSDLLEDLFGSEDVDLRQLSSTQPLPTPTPPMPVASISPSAGVGWLPRSRPVSEAASLPNLPAGRVRPGFGGRTQTRFSALEEGWSSPSNVEDGSGSPANLDIILNQAEEQHRNGMLDDGELGTIIKQVMEVNETKMLREVQRREGRANKENWSDKPGPYPMGMDERMACPMPPMVGPVSHTGPVWEDEGVGSGMHGGRMPTVPPFVIGRGASRDPRYRAPLPPAGSQQPPRPFFPAVGGPMFESRGPSPGGGFGPIVPPQARPFDGRFDMSEEDPMKTINIDNMPREIRFYGDTAIILMSAEDPRELSFHPGSRSVYLDGMEFECRLGEGYREFTYDGMIHRVKLGAPTREVIVDGKWYECLFGGPPIVVTLEGGKQVPLRLSGPAPTVKIGEARRADLVVGKVNMIVNARDVIPVYLDGKTQYVNIGGKTVSIRFRDSLRTVIVDDKPYSVHFGGLPEPMWVDGRRHYVRFSALPRGVEPGLINIIGMDGDGLPHVPFAREEPHKLPSHARTQLDFLANNMTTPVSAAPAAGGYQFQDISMLSVQNLPTGGALPSTDTSNIPSIPNITDVGELLAKLAASGLLPQINAPKVEEKKKIKPKKEEETVKEITFTTDGLKMRNPALINLIHLGMQCSSCGLRFPPELTLRYSQHLDWHFRQNRRERDAAKKAQSRKWYYQLSDWLLFEETEDVEDKGQSYFDNQPGEREEEKEEQASIPVGDKTEDNQCAVCHEALEQFYNEESEEWHLKDAVRVETGTYHRLCYQDHLTIKTQEYEEEPEPEEELMEKEETVDAEETKDEPINKEEGESEKKVAEDVGKHQEMESDMSKEAEVITSEEAESSNKKDSKAGEPSLEATAVGVALEQPDLVSSGDEHLPEVTAEVTPLEEAADAEAAPEPIVPPAWFDPSLVRIKEEPQSPGPPEISDETFDSEGVAIKQERMDVDEASCEIPSEELALEKVMDEGDLPSLEAGTETEKEEPAIATPVIPETFDSTSHIMSSSIDGNVETEINQVSSQIAPTKIRINFSFNKTAVSVALPAVSSPAPPVRAASPEKPLSRPASPAEAEKVAAPTSKAGTPVPPEQVSEACERDFVPPVVTDEMLVNKPKLRGRKFDVLSPEKKGTELSGLCSIM